MRALSLTLGLFLPLLTSAADWPQWRGPQRTGVTAEKDWTSKWPDEGPKVAWKATVGLGYSSFVVAGGRAVTLGHAKGQDTVFCFDVASGRVLWKHSYAAELGDKYFDGGTTGTPTIAGDRVYALSRWGDLFCFQLADGKVVWSKNVQKETDIPSPDWGFGGAPLVWGDALFLNVGEFGMALDAATGAFRWRSPAESAGYSTPLPFQLGTETALLFSSGQSYSAVDPRSGKRLWSLRWVTQYGVNAADPIVQGDRIYVSSGYGKGSGSFKLPVGAAEPEQVWKSKALRTQMNAAVLYQGHLYGVDGDTTEKASLKCLEWNTGAERWSSPGFGSGGVIVADGKLLALGGTGELVVAPASPEGFKPISRAQVLGGKTWTAPVLANGYVLCRNSRGEVVCLDLRLKRD
ncbi:MAG: PQQ-binding-like beta-propeller repeat protein [Verrucomicrobiales bacterium]|nr:PQQ-binding-like beta-propeller repeat protein [Verrucomicrobiales bacterium]